MNPIVPYFFCIWLIMVELLQIFISHKSLSYLFYISINMIKISQLLSHWVLSFTTHIFLFLFLLFLLIFEQTGLIQMGHNNFETISEYFYQTCKKFLWSQIASSDVPQIFLIKFLEFSREKESKIVTIEEEGPIWRPM